MVALETCQLYAYRSRLLSPCSATVSGVSKAFRSLSKNAHNPCFSLTCTFDLFAGFKTGLGNGSFDTAVGHLGPVLLRADTPLFLLRSLFGPDREIVVENRETWHRVQTLDDVYLIGICKHREPIGDIVCIAILKVAIVCKAS